MNNSNYDLSKYDKFFLKNKYPLHDLYNDVKYQDLLQFQIKLSDALINKKYTTSEIIQIYKYYIDECKNQTDIYDNEKLKILSLLKNKKKQKNINIIDKINKLTKEFNI